MSNAGSPTVRRPLAAKPSIYSRLSASPSVPRPAGVGGAAGIGSSSSSSVTRGAANGSTASVTAARGASRVSTTSPSASPTLRGKPTQTTVVNTTSVSSRKAGGGVQGKATGVKNKSSSMASQFSSTGSPLLGQTQNNLGVSIIGGRGGVDDSSSSFAESSPKVAAAQCKHPQHEDPYLLTRVSNSGAESSVGLSADGNPNTTPSTTGISTDTTRGFSQEAMGRGSPLFQPVAADSSNGYTFSSQLTSKAPSVAGTTVPISSIVESSIAFDTENHIRNFNDELVRDNELMLQEIEELRDENDIMFDELHRLRTENALLKDQNSELLESVNGQNEAFVRLSSEVAREMTITESLRKTFDTLHANRFDNLFTKMSRARHASLGRPPTTRENLQMAREALDESNRQINNIFEIVHSMSQVPNFMSNPKDVLVVDATMQVISLCKVINSMIVAEKMGGGGGASSQGKETDRRTDSMERKGKSVLEGMAGAIASITPRPSSKAPNTAPLPSAGSSSQSHGSQRQQEKQPQTARARVGSGGDGGGISGFFKRIGKSSTSQKDQAVVEEVETLVTVLTARPGNSSTCSYTTATTNPPNALQLPNEHIHMPVSAKEVDKRATLLQRIASVFKSHGGSTVTPSSSAAVSRTNSLVPQISSSSPSKAKSTFGGGASTANRSIPIASNYFSDKTLPARRVPSPPPATTVKKGSASSAKSAEGASASPKGSQLSISNVKKTDDSRGPYKDIALIARIEGQNERFARSETTAVAARAENDNDNQWDECGDNAKSGETSEDDHQIMKALEDNRVLENEAGRATEAYVHRTEEKEEEVDSDDAEARVADGLLEEGEDATPVTFARRTRRPDSMRNLDEMSTPHQTHDGGNSTETPLARHRHRRDFAANLRYSSINATPPLSGRSAQLNE